MPNVLIAVPGMLTIDSPAERGHPRVEQFEISQSWQHRCGEWHSGV
jgi:hypothetical protein